MAFSNLNNSVAKQQFSFSKDSRFPTLKQNTRNISHAVFNKTSEFGKHKNFSMAGTNAFGSHSKRFNDSRTNAKAAALPGPLSYSTNPRTFSPEVSRSNGWSVGLGRDVCDKLHIDRLQHNAKKKIASPAPNVYEKDPTFGKAGPHYTVRKRMKRYGNRSDKYDDSHFANEKKLPGPG